MPFGSEYLLAWGGGEWFSDPEVSCFGLAGSGDRRCKLAGVRFLWCPVSILGFYFRRCMICACSRLRTWWYPRTYPRLSEQTDMPLLPFVRHVARCTAFAAALLGSGITAQAQTIGQVVFVDGFEIDATVLQDRTELETASLEALQSLLGSAPGANVPVVVTYIGKGHRVSDNVFEAAPNNAPPASTGDAIDGFSAFNPRTGNEFRIQLATADLNLVGTETSRQQRDLGAGPMGGPIPGDNPDVLPGRGKSWSNLSDDRTWLSSLTQGTSTWPWRAINEHNNRCSSTLIGPRHIVTAAHCLYNRASNSWSSNFAVTPRRAANNFNYGRSQIPSPGFTWFFTPWQWRQANPSGGSVQYDVGIMVLPDRLGDLTGWMGYATLDNTTLQNSVVYNRGFPWCNAVDSNNVARIDDVGDDPNSGLVCNDRHLYGDPSPCSIGSFQATDGQGWQRRFNHSCDASAGQSGSPLYLYFNGGGPRVIGVHTLSLCGKTAGDVPCQPTDARPLQATRFTPEYSNWISYFRNWKP